jgi:thioredoxin-like negative regulator of GroEL
MTVIDFDENVENKIIENESPLLNNDTWFVLYYAEWCGHCKNFTPKWDELANKCKDKMNFAKIEQSIFNKKELGYNPSENIDGYPTIYLRKNGKDVEQYSGERSLEALEKYIDSNVSSDKKKKSPASRRRGSRRRGSASRRRGSRRRGSASRRRGSASRRRGSRS